MSLTDSQFMRYSRHLLMDDIGEQGQEKLLNAHVNSWVFLIIHLCF